MSKQSSIRWRDSDREDLRKAVKNFNAKIRRLEKKNPKDASALPEKVKMKEIESLVETRQDLKRELNALKRFTKRGAEELVDVPDSKYNLKTTKWQKQEMARRTGVINRKRNERYKKIKEVEMKSRGKDLGYKKGDIGMGSQDENALKPMKPFYPSMSRKDLNKRFRAIRKESKESYWAEKEARLKANVMKGIEANYKGLYPEQVEKILEAIENMDFKEFYEKFIAESGEMEIVSPPPGSSMDEMMKVNIEVLMSTWVPNYQSPMEDEVNQVREELRERINSQKE